MSELLTVDELRGHVETSLDDDALGRILDACEAELVRWAGPLTFTDYDAPDPVTETVYWRGRTFGQLRQVPATDGVQTVVEWNSGTASELVEWDPDDGTGDWRTDGAGYLYRMPTGLRWGDRADVTYVPGDDRAIRRAALIMIVKGDLNFEPGMGSQSAGGWQEAYAAWQQARNEQLQRVRQAELFA